jgi:hypothetical protein
VVRHCTVLISLLMKGDKKGELEESKEWWIRNKGRRRGKEGKLATEGGELVEAWAGGGG